MLRLWIALLLFALPAFAGPASGAQLVVERLGDSLYVRSPFFRASQVPGDVREVSGYFGSYSLRP